MFVYSLGITKPPMAVLSFYHRRFFFSMSVFNGLVHTAGGISVSGIALILLAAHKCAKDWPASRAKNTCYPLTGLLVETPPLCKGELNSLCEFVDTPLRGGRGGVFARKRRRDCNSLYIFLLCFDFQCLTIPQSASPTRLAPSRSLPAGDALPAPFTQGSLSHKSYASPLFSSPHRQ